MTMASSLQLEIQGAALCDVEFVAQGRVAHYWGPGDPSPRLPGGRWADATSSAGEQLAQRGFEAIVVARAWHLWTVPRESVGDRLAVEVEIFGARGSGIPRRRILVLERPTTVRQIARLVRLNPDDFGLAIIDGVQSEMGDRVPPTCRLCFLPPWSGG